jgi:hypothetical protein
VVLLIAASCAAFAQAPVSVPTPVANPASGQPQTTPSRGATQSDAHRPGSADSKAAVTTAESTSTAPPIVRAPGVIVDQVIGVVNGDLILESDIDEERRFEAFQPFTVPGRFNRDRAIERLVNRALILQQAQLQPEQEVTLDEARAQLQTLRKELPACKAYHCETDAGWQKFVSEQGFTNDELLERWRQRMQTLKFIELRFRAGIQITPAQIKTYYEQKMLPEYAKVHATPPKLEVLSDRIQEILLEEQVTNLLSDWLKSLKAEGNVRMMRPGEVEP